MFARFVKGKERKRHLSQLLLPRKPFISLGEIRGGIVALSTSTAQRWKIVAHAENVNFIQSLERKEVF